MKVSRILGSFTPSFKAQNPDGGVLGYDDEISKQKRNLIREHFYNETMPYQSIYENEPRRENHETDKLLASWYGVKNLKDLEKLKESRPVYHPKPSEQKSNGIDCEIMKCATMYNKSPLGKNRMEVHVYRGSTPFENENNLKILKDAGVETVVDLCRWYDGEKLCDKNGLKYLSIETTSDYFSTYDKLTSESKLNYADNLVQFIKAMQQDKVYVGCQFGKDTTDNALMLNYLFNPKTTQTKSYINSYSKTNLPKMKDLYNDLTPENKKDMGWTEEFDKNFIPRLDELMKEHGFAYDKMPTIEDAENIDIEELVRAAEEARRKWPLPF